MRAIGEIVEEEIGERIARQMLRIGHFIGEDDALRRDAARLRLRPHAVVGLFRAGQQPQHAVGNRRKMRAQRSKVRAVSFCMPLSEQ